MAALAGRIMIFVYSWQDAAEGSFAWVDAGLLVDDETGHCRQVAVKRLKRRSELGGALLFQTASEAFARERALCVSLEPHDNVVRTIGAARVAGEPVLLLEYAHCQHGIQST